MAAKMQANARKKGTRGTGPQTRQSLGLAGDVPRRQAVDYRTTSVVPPQPTGTLTFRQLAPIQTFQVVGGAATAPVVNFALNGVAGSSTLTSLFDLYKIDAVRLTVRPNNTAIALADPTVTSLVPIYWVIDYNDSAPLGSAAAATEYDNCMVLSPGESGERTFCPMYKMVTASAAGTDYVSKRGDWLASSSDDIFHYGCKFYIPAGAAVQTFLQTWTVEIEYFFTFRQVS